MNGGIRLGKIFGIEITLDYSWFIIFAIITFVLSFSLFPQLVPGLSTTAYIIIGGITSVLFFSSVLFHEMVHSIIAKRNGIDIRGIRLIIFGGVSQIAEEPRTPGVEFKVAIAGPLSSIVLGGAFLGISVAGNQAGLGPLVVAPAFWLGYINIFLGVFNLLPGFPLDGGRVFRSAIWYFTGNLVRSTNIAAGVGKGIAYLMIFAGIVGPLFGGLISLVWFVLLGWFLLRAAEAERIQVIYHEALEGVKVGEIMTENPETVEPGISIQEMVERHFMRRNWVAYPVVENGNVRGMITLKSLENLPRSQWAYTSVGNVMRPLSPDIVTRPDAEVFNILPKLSTIAEGRILVMQDDQLVGLLTETDVNRAIVRRLHLEEMGRPAA
ncbi:MAG TPA: site-2 protease family protein [Anaerolineae bacterium]|nr:site-2 protease family protein [Anaerolineae bacterium]